jgi:hypothetical protein
MTTSVDQAEVVAYSSLLCRTTPFLHYDLDSLCHVHGNIHGFALIAHGRNSPGQVMSEAPSGVEVRHPSALQTMVKALALAWAMRGCT